jgi:hypothetical protein
MADFVGKLSIVLDLLKETGFNVERKPGKITGQHSTVEYT